MRKYECEPIFNSCHRLFSVTPSGDVSIGIAIRNNNLQVVYRDHNVHGRGWYSDALTLLERLFRQQMVEFIKNNLVEELDGVNLIYYLKKNTDVDRKLTPYGVTLDQLVDAGVSINADVTPQGLKFAIDLPRQIRIGF